MTAHVLSTPAADLIPLELIRAVPITERTAGEVADEHVVAAVAVVVAESRKPPFIFRCSGINSSEIVDVTVHIGTDITVAVPPQHDVRLSVSIEIGAADGFPFVADMDSECVPFRSAAGIVEDSGDVPVAQNSVGVDQDVVLSVAVDVSHADEALPGTEIAGGERHPLVGAIHPQSEIAVGGVLPEDISHARCR